MATTDTPAGPSQPEDYGMEVMCANWNPVLAVAVEPVGLTANNLPAIDADAFLKQFYCCQ